MGNEIITLVKDTSLARIVGVGEIIMCAERFTKEGLIWPLFSTGLFFLVMCGALTVIFNVIDNKIQYYKAKLKGFYTWQFCKLKILIKALEKQRF